jgi:hypothetical protein
MKWLAALLSIPLVACSGSDSWPHQGGFSGTYGYGFEQSDFTPSGTNERWWLAGAVPCKQDGKAANSSPVLYLEFKAHLTPPGRYGHLGQYSREVTPTEFVVCRVAAPRELPK